MTLDQDRWDIMQVLHRYCELVDADNWPAMDEVFTQDTVGLYNGMEVAGLATLQANADLNMTEKTIAATQHNVSNFRIDVDGDHARCRSNYYAVHSGAGDFAGAIYSMWGEYDDKLLRTDKGWRIARRDYTTHFTQGPDEMVFAGNQPTWNKDQT